MKKLFTILLLILFLFNIAGYRVWFYFAQQQSDEKVLVSLDKEDYNADELITIKIPISIPYQINSKDFERVNGEVKLNGKIYKYVKRKVYGGQLVLLCLPDENKSRLQSEKNDFFKYANDLQNTTSKKQGQNNTNSFKNLLSDYDQQKTQSFDAIPNQIVSYSNPLNIFLLPSHSGITPEQPPETPLVV